jgi:hypothetical protein
MKVGEIYFWPTNKAIGYDSRDKYHIYICAGDWRDGGHTFLFISKADYGGDFQILKRNYNFFPLEVSFISCSSVVTYTDDELKATNPELKGRLTNSDMQALFAAIAASESMEGWNIKKVCEALKSAFD